MTVEFHSSVNINADVVQLAAEAMAAHNVCKRPNRTSRLQRNLFLAFVGCCFFVFSIIIIPAFRERLLIWPMLMYSFLFILGGTIGWMASLYYLVHLPLSEGTIETPRNPRETP